MAREFWTGRELPIYQCLCTCWTKSSKSRPSSEAKLLVFSIGCTRSRAARHRKVRRRAQRQGVAREKSFLQHLRNVDLLVDRLI